jgi:hypothetical protein
MIVYPASLLSSSSVPLTHPRIGWQNRLRDLDPSLITVSSEAETGPLDAPTRADTFSFWEPTALPATWVANMGQTFDVDYVGVWGRMGSLGLAVKAETSQDSGANWTQLGGDVLQADDAPIMFLDGVRSANAIRITISGSSSTMPRLAIAYAGEALAMERHIYGGHAPVNLQRDTVLQQPLSRGGQFLGQTFRRLGVTGSAAFKNLTPSWYRDNIEPFVKEARRFPFFWAWQPEDFPEDVVYGWLEDDPKPAYMGDIPLMQVSFKIRGIGYE